MLVKVYQNKEDNNKVSKKPVFQNVTFDAKITDSTSYFNLVLEVSDKQYLTKQWNYFEIPDLDRFFFLEDIILLKNHMVELHLRVDVLKTFEVAIGRSVTMVERSALGGSAFLHDTSLPLSSKRVQMIDSVGSFSNTLKNYIIVTGKGGAE